MQCYKAIAYEKTKFGRQNSNFKIISKILQKSQKSQKKKKLLII